MINVGCGANRSRLAAKMYVLQLVIYLYSVFFINVPSHRFNISIAFCAAYLHVLRLIIYTFRFTALHV